VKRLKGKIDQFSSLFFCLLLFLTPFTNAQLLGNFFQQPKVFVESFTKPIEIEGKRFDAFHYIRIIQYPNRTKNIHLSITVENVSRIIPKIRMNLTKTVSPSEFQGSEMSSEIERPLRSMNAVETYAIPEYLWDGLYAVRAGTWEGYWIKYDHDNNLWRYYPIFDFLFSLP